MCVPGQLPISLTGEVNPLVGFETKRLSGGRACKPDSPERVDAKQLA